MSKQDYRFIRAWGLLLGSASYYITQQIAIARKEHAPERAVCRMGDKWTTVDEIPSDSTRKQVLQIAGCM